VKQSKVIPAFLLSIGCFFLGYPKAATLYNAYHNTRVEAAYTKQMHKQDQTVKKAYALATKYNHLMSTSSAYKSSVAYGDLLNVNHDGMMGFVNVEKYQIHLPIYHGTSAAVLQKGAGHIERTSLPVGGKSTHCVISAHTGLPSGKMFDDIRKMKIGDTFTLTVLNKTLSYQVDHIAVVKPEDLSVLKEEKDKDECSLLTCTPLGVNDHRLVVRGHRIATQKVMQNTSKNVIIMQVAILILLSFMISLRVLIHKKYERNFMKGKAV
jgi:sortase A